MSEPGSSGATEAPVALLVDDEDDVRESIGEMLEALGWRVLPAPGYGEAARILNGGDRIDALISDVVMPPGPGGVELAERARGLRPGMTVLLVSGYVAEALGAIGSLAWPLLPKPFTIDSLQRALASAAAKASAVGARG